MTFKLIFFFFKLRSSPQTVRLGKSKGHKKQTSFSGTHVGASQEVSKGQLKQGSGWTEVGRRYWPEAQGGDPAV